MADITNEIVSRKVHKPKEGKILVLVVVRFCKENHLSKFIIIVY